ncbi:MAG: nitroreductase family protein [Actinomycetota bacterium]|nr:nitroreductase family protein [Actinomycetota bacterium]
MNLTEAVAARRSVRAFQDRAVPRDLVERAVSLAVQAPAPHHSSPWRFALLDSPEDKGRLAADMGAAWRADLTADGLPNDRIEAILSRSEGLLRSTPLLTVCCADMTRSHGYTDDRRRLAEWSLFAHSVGAALQTYMTALAESGVASCWISAPVFCREQVQRALSLPAEVEPHALVLVGYASPDYHPRPRPAPDPRAYIL